FTYTWSNGATTNSISADTGTYWCTVSSGSCSATDTVVITGPPKLTAAFIYTLPDCSTGVVSFTNQSATAGGSIVSWSWNFGDGQESSAQSPSHIYMAAGSYTVTLTVTNSQGCTDTITKAITIYALPAASFTAAPACLGNSNAFTSGGSGAVSYSWKFGDG